MARLTAVQLRAVVVDLLAAAGVPQPSDLDAAKLIGALDGALGRAGYCLMPLNLNIPMRDAMASGFEPVRSWDSAYQRAVAAKDLPG